MNQREIKFRAWDKNYQNVEGKRVGQMFYSNDYGAGLSAFFKLAEENKREITQFTGLKDKNGKEIYERDIVKIFNTNYEIAFEDGKFIAKGYYMGSQDDPRDFIESIENTEVIGNIYENPELLNQK